jgi:hypothetical protein
MDVIYVAIAVACFAASLALVRLCGSLGGDK